jgi:hypothetical protein
VEELSAQLEEVGSQSLSIWLCSISVECTDTLAVFLMSCTTVISTFSRPLVTRAAFYSTTILQHNLMTPADWIYDSQILF